jgi:hypothetical protein
MLPNDCSFSSRCLRVGVRWRTDPSVPNHGNGFNILRLAHEARTATCSTTSLLLTHRLLIDWNKGAAPSSLVRRTSRAALGRAEGGHGRSCDSGATAWSRALDFARGELRRPSLRSVGTQRRQVLQFVPAPRPSAASAPDHFWSTRSERTVESCARPPFSRPGGRAPRGR